MSDFLSKLFDTSDFPARWHCGNWTAGHGWLHILSDLGVWSAYVAIPCVLGYFVLRRKDIPFRSIFVLFGAFILACGTTHLMEATIFWWPAYRLAGLIKLFTAFVSWGTVFALIPVAPKALAMRSPEDLEREITARKKAENALEQANAELRRQVAALQASEERFRLLVDGTRDHAIFMLDPSGHVASWNPGAKRIKGYRAEEIVGQHFSCFYPVEEARSGKPDHNLKVAAAEGRFEEEGWRVRKDGSRFWANVVITPLRDDAGNLRGYSKITRDMSDRKQAEENARRLLEEAAARRAAEEHAQVIERQREQLRVTLTSIGDAVVTTDAKGRVTLLNPVAEALTGWTNGDAAGQPLSTVFHIVNEKSRQPVENPVDRVLATGKIVGLANHTNLIARDGTERCIDDSAAPILDRNGNTTGVVLVFRDVTEIRKSERSARFLASIVESSDDAIIGKDVNGIITSWNQGAQRIFGYSADEALGRPVAMLSPPDRTDEMPDILQRVRAGERVDHFDTVRRAKDGRLVPISLTVSPIRDEDGEIIGASKIARDISERKRAEEALREEKERLHATLTGIGDAVIVTDAESRITLMNPVAQRLTGWDEDAAGRPLDEVFRIVNEQSRQPVESPVIRVISEGTTVGLANHTALVARDGTERPIEDSAAPVRDSNGEVVGVVLVFRDATERRVAEAAAQKNQEIFKLVHTIGKIGHWEWNSLTDENQWSPEIQALYGLEPGTFEGTYDAWAKLVHPDDLPRAAEDVRRALETGRFFTEFRVVWPDGSVHWLEARANVFKDGHDKPVRIMGVNMDVTDRKRQEETLRNSEQKLAAELEAITRLHSLSTRLLSAENLRSALDDLLENAIVTTRADFGNVQLYNSESGALEIVAQRGFQQDFLDYFRTVRVDEGSACAQAMQAGERIVIEDVNLDPTYEAHRRIAAAAGYRGVQSTPLKNHRGVVFGMLSTHFRTPHRPSERDERLLDLYARHAADVIERIKIEQELKAADRRKDEFLATLAHELRNPLAPVRNAVELLRQAGDDPSVRGEAHTIMERQIGQMVRLIDDLMDISRVTSGKLKLHKERAELAAVVQSAVEETRPFIEASGHQLTVTLPREAVALDADPTRLAQIFSNLLSNAAKYTDTGGHICLTAERHEGEVRVLVRDTGIGIDADHLSHIFEMFSQAAPALERSQGGLGIGLALVRGLVELHGGTIEARSNGPGMGSEFVVRLPVSEVQIQTRPEGPEEEQGKAASGLKRRILVVDDNADSATSLAMILQRLGHEIQTAHDGLEAVQAAAAFRPQVILLDIGLPKMNGYEAAKRIREQSSGEKVAIIALTGWGQEKDKQMALDAGIDHHLTKPFEPAALERLLAIIAPS